MEKEKTAKVYLFKTIIIVACKYISIVFFYKKFNYFLLFVYSTSFPIKSCSAVRTCVVFVDIRNSILLLLVCELPVFCVDADTDEFAS